MEDCYFLDEFGCFKIKKSEELDMRYAHLECVIKNKMNVSDMYYPYIMASTPDKYLKKIKIAMNAAKNNIQYIEMTGKVNKHEYPIIYFYSDNKEKAILFNYLLQKYQKIHAEDFNPIDYILNELRGLGEDYNKRFFKARYINRIIPQILPDEVDKILSNQKLSMKDKYMAKYKLADKHDKFALFNKKYKMIEEEAGKILEKTKKDKNFIKYSKTVKIHPFQFTIKKSIGNNPFFKEIEPKVKEYAKSLNIKI